MFGRISEAELQWLEDIYRDKTPNEECPWGEKFQAPSPGHPMRAKHLYRIEQQEEVDDKAENDIIHIHYGAADIFMPRNPLHKYPHGTQCGQKEEYCDE